MKKVKRDELRSEYRREDLGLKKRDATLLFRLRGIKV